MPIVDEVVDHFLCISQFPFAPEVLRKTATDLAAESEFEAVTTATFVEAVLRVDNDIYN